MQPTIDKPMIHSDARGIVFEPVDAALLHRQRNVHVVITQPGSVRGNHYHRHSTEILIIMGPALVRLRVEKEIREISIPSQAVYRLRIPPGISHAVYNTGERPNFLIAFNSATHDRKTPDVTRDMLIIPEEFNHTSFTKQ